MDPEYARLQYFQKLYLSQDGADVWFVIDGERIPSHKLILTAMSEYYKTMFYGSLPETGEINMNDANISAESFKEFLKFIYLVKPNLTMDNIEGVINMAQISLSEDIFMECEKFLKNTLEKDTLFYGYQLALQYEIDSVKLLCEEEICVHIEGALKSKSFLQFPYEFLQVILRSDSLACEEKDIFNACIAWGKAACRRNGLDPKNMEHLRSQLGDSLYQIRFTSMTNEDAAACIGPHPGLFTLDELQEIICMIGHNQSFQATKFNWTSRFFNLKWNKGLPLECSRFVARDNGKILYNVERCEITRFTCNRRIILSGLILELASHNSKSIQIKINEINSDEHSVERHSQRATARFLENKDARYSSFLANIQLNKWILLRPNYTYEISITFEHQMVDMTSLSSFKQKIRVNHDIVLNFSSRGIVAELSVQRFDNRKSLRKIVHNPIFWILTTLIIVILSSTGAYFVFPDLWTKIMSLWPHVLTEVWPIVWPCLLLATYIAICLFLSSRNRTPPLNR